MTYEDLCKTFAFNQLKNKDTIFIDLDDASIKHYCRKYVIVSIENDYVYCRPVRRDIREITLRNFHKSEFREYKLRFVLQ